MKISSFWKFLNPYRNLRKMKVLDGIHSCKEFRMIIERERTRVDRDNLGFALVVFNIGNAEANGNYSINLINVLHYRRLRLPDEIGWFDKQRIGVLLYNTGKEGAWRFVNNIQGTFPAKYHPLDSKVYIYPVDDFERIPIIPYKRKRERFNILTKCLIYTDGDNGDNYSKVTNGLLTTNISTSGVFLQTDHPMPIGTEVILNIVHFMNCWKRHDEENNVTKVTGYVLRVDEIGMAIRFDKDYPVNSL